MNNDILPGMRLRKYFIVGFFVSPLFLFGQFPVAPDIVYDFIRSNSIHRQQVDWGKVDQVFWSSISSAYTIQDTMDAFVKVLKELDDVHSQVYLDNHYYGYWRPNEGEEAPRLTALVEQARATTGHISSAWLPDSVAYVRVPGFNGYGPDEVRAFGRMLRDTINNFGKLNPKGFILDLRLNMGGNIYPMLSGLGGFLKDGDIAYEVDLGDTIVRAWRMRGGNFIMNDFPLTYLEEPDLKKLEDMPVAVLIGPVTTSSGSMLAISFKGRRNTVSIGEPSATGYTTSNGYFQFAPNFFMNLAIAYVADRNMHLYPTTVEPDILVREGDDFEKLVKDEKIKRALVWLKGKTD